MTYSSEEESRHFAFMVDEGAADEFLAIFEQNQRR